MTIDNRSIAIALDRFIDNTLNKIKGVNKPFKAIQQTDDYKDFENLFAESIAKQGKWASNNIDSLLNGARITEGTPELSFEQKQIIKGQIVRDMPSLTTYISEDKLFLKLKDFFEWSAVQQYMRWGVMAKADGTVEFKLTNPQYIDALEKQASYLLNQSSLDETTIEQIISTISNARLEALTASETAQLISDSFDVISKSRADMIARTEAANSMGMANHATAKENGAETKQWVAAGGGNDEICGGNADVGFIPIDDEFPSGDMYEPGHPNCECYTEAGLIDLDNIDLWSGE